MGRGVASKFHVPWTGAPDGYVAARAEVDSCRLRWGRNNTAGREESERLGSLVVQLEDCAGSCVYLCKCCDDRRLFGVVSKKLSPCLVPAAVHRHTHPGCMLLGSQHDAMFRMD